MNTFLPPIEHPHGLIMRLAYYFTRHQFGKVLTPLKVHVEPNSLLAADKSSLSKYCDQRKLLSRVRWPHH